MSALGKEKTLEEKLSNASTFIHVAGAIPLFFATAIVGNGNANDDTVFNLIVSGFGIEGIALMLSGSAILTRPDKLNRREQLDVAGRVLLGTGFISIPALAVVREVASSNSLRSISAFTLLTIATGSVALGLSQDIGNVMKW